MWRWSPRICMAWDAVLTFLSLFVASPLVTICCNNFPSRLLLIDSRQSAQVGHNRISHHCCETSRAPWLSFSSILDWQTSCVSPFALLLLGSPHCQSPIITIQTLIYVQFFPKFRRLRLFLNRHKLLAVSTEGLSSRKLCNKKQTSLLCANGC